MTKKLKQIVTDTVVIIDAHENDYWSQLCNSYSVLLPATVIESEAFYFQSDRGKIGMNPSEWIEQKKIVRVEGALEDLMMLKRRLSPDFYNALDAGEIEALVVLLSKKNKDMFFTTADKAAVKALGILGLGSQGVSVEELLTNKGIKRKGSFKFPTHFTKKWFQAVLAEGLREQHLWLNPNP